MLPNNHAIENPDLPLVEVDGLSKLFPIAGNLFRKPSGFAHAVDGVSFQLAPGESLGLVGESGCGKTTVGKLLLKLLDPTGGSISFNFPGKTEDAALRGRVDASTLTRRQMRDFRRHVQLIFQDPYESMNPRRTIYDTIAEPLSVQRIGNVLDRVDRVAEILTLVGLTPATTFLFRYPHELSGGQRQRVAIARALIVGPSLVVADGTDLHAGCVQPHGHHGADAGACRGHGSRLPLHHPRSGGRQVHVRSDRRDVHGEDSGNGGHGGTAAQSPASIH